MNNLERLQALERDLPEPGSLYRMLMDGDDSEWERALKAAAPDLIAVAVAAQVLMEPPQPCSSCGIVHEDRPTKEARKNASTQLASALAPLLESEGEE